MVDSNCRVCGCDNTKIINVQEKHYATFDKFDYLKCEECNSLSIKNIPHDIARYYQADTYYSFKKIEYNTKSFKSLLKSIYWKKIIVSNHLIFNFLKKLKRLDDSNFFVILRNTNINLKSKILDIGCGSGDILKQLHSFGFKNLLGIEPNIEEDISIKKNKLIIKTMLEDYVEKCKEKFDLIMLNHSFEHMPNPNEILDSIKKISHKDTCLLLRIPLANSYAHRKYNENWVQLDAPRHLFLYSEGGGIGIV